MKLQEKDISLSKQHSRHWTEIQTHKYCFDRQQQEIASLSEVSLDDFKRHFTETFFSPSSKRLDLNLTSAIHAEEQRVYESKNSCHPAVSCLTQQRHSLESIKESPHHPDVFKDYYARFVGH